MRWARRLASARSWSRGGSASRKEQVVVGQIRVENSGEVRPACAVGDFEYACYTALGCAIAKELRRCAQAQQNFDGADDEALARASWAGEDVKAGCKIDGRI